MRSVLSDVKGLHICVVDLHCRFYVFVRIENGLVTEGVTGLVVYC